MNGRASAVAAVGDGSDSRTVAPPARPVFVDSTGKRSRTWRRAGTITALCCTCYATTVVAALVGGDSSAPFFQLPRAMGLEREVGERPAESRDEDGAASATEAALGTPGPVTSDQARLSAAERPTVQRPPAASSGPAGIPAVDVRPAAPTSGPKTPDPAPGGNTQTGGGGEVSPSEPSAPAPETGSGSGTDTPAGGGDDTQGPEAEAPSGGPLGDLLGGVLGGLLGGA